MAATIEVRVLGPLEVAVDGVPVAIADPKERALVAALSLEGNSVVSVDALVDSLWGDAVPNRAVRTLQQRVSSLRKLLGAVTPATNPATILATRRPGYVLNVDRVDTDDFEQATAEGIGAASAGRWVDARRAYDTALALWRGPALADARESPHLEAAAARLDDQRGIVVERSLEARLECGDASAVVPDLEQLVAELPQRQQLRALLTRAVARTRAGRLELPGGQAVPLVEGTTLIGRDRAAAVRLRDNRVSRRHAEIDETDGKYVLRDLGSTNGTTVNGERVVEHVLADGDIVCIGEVELRFAAAKP